MLHARTLLRRLPLGVVCSSWHCVGVLWWLSGRGFVWGAHWTRYCEHKLDQHNLAKHESLRVSISPKVIGGFRCVVVCVCESVCDEGRGKGGGGGGGGGVSRRTV